MARPKKITVSTVTAVLVLILSIFFGPDVVEAVKLAIVSTSPAL